MEPPPEAVHARPRRRLGIDALEVEPEPTAAELNALAHELREEITFGVDSGAAVTVVGPDVAPDYPRSFSGARKRMSDCQGNPVKDLGEKSLAFAAEGGQPVFAKVTVAPVAKNLLAVSSLVRQGHEVVFRPEENGGCFIRHLRTGTTKKMTAKNGVYEATYKLESFSTARLPPERGRS